MFQNKELLIFLTGIILVLLAGLLQNTELISFYSVKVNLVLILLLVLIFFVHDLRYYLILALEGVLLLKVAPGLDVQTLVLLFLVLAAFYLKKRLVWQPVFSNALLIAVATVLFYALADFNFMIYSTPTLILEIIYNTIGGSALYLALERVYGVRI